MHRVLQVPFEYKVDETQFLQPVIFDFPDEQIDVTQNSADPFGDTVTGPTAVTIPQWIHLSFQNSPVTEMLLLYYPKYFSAVEMLWLFYSYVIKQKKDKKTDEEIKKTYNQFNEIIQKWIKLNYHNEWCCLKEETINCSDSNLKFPLTNLKTEALKIINSETENLIFSVFPCNSIDENIDTGSNIFPPKLLFEFSELQIVEEISFNHLKILKNISGINLLHQDNWIDKSKKNPITELITDTEKFCNGLIHFILHLETPESRALLISKLIDIAHFAAFNDKLPNYQLATFIIASLNSACIARLKQSWKYVTNVEKRALVEELISPDKAYLNLRSKQKDTSIHYIGIPLTDITFICEGNTFTDDTANCLTVKLRPITYLYRTIEGYISNVKTAGNISLSKTVNLKQALEFLLTKTENKEKLEDKHYAKSLFYEPRGGTDFICKISEQISSICEKILELAKNEKYFSVQEKYYSVLLPGCSLENCYSVLKHLSKKQIKKLCLNLQSLIATFGTSFIKENDYEDSMNYRILLIHFDARIINVANHFKLKDDTLKKITDVCPAVSSQKSARK